MVHLAVGETVCPGPQALPECKGVSGEFCRLWGLSSMTPWGHWRLLLHLLSHYRLSGGRSFLFLIRRLSHLSGGGRVLLGSAPLLSSFQTLAEDNHFLLQLSCPADSLSVASDSAFRAVRNTHPQPRRPSRHSAFPKPTLQDFLCLYRGPVHLGLFPGGRPGREEAGHPGPHTLGQPPFHSSQRARSLHTPLWRILPTTPIVLQSLETRQVQPGFGRPRKGPRRCRLVRHPFIGIEKQHQRGHGKSLLHPPTQSRYLPRRHRRGSRHHILLRMHLHSHFQGTLGSFVPRRGNMAARRKGPDFLHFPYRWAQGSVTQEALRAMPCP